MFRLTEGDPESPVGFNAATIEYPNEKNIKVEFAIAAVLDEEQAGSPRRAHGLQEAGVRPR